MPNPHGIDWKAQGLQQGVCYKCGGPAFRFRILPKMACDACKKESLRERTKKAYLKKDVETRRAISRESAKKFREANPEKARESSRRSAQRPEAIERRKQYVAENAERIKQQKSEWHKANPLTEEDKARHNEWRISTGWSVKRHRERYANDPVYKLKMDLRNRLRAAIKGKAKSGSAVKLLGCSGEHAIAHIEAQFQTGMTWDNWGLQGWTIDHRVPLSAFDLQDPEQLAKACHYTNLQPLWAIDNLRKGGKT